MTAVKTAAVRSARTFLTSRARSDPFLPARRSRKAQGEAGGCVSSGPLPARCLTLSHLFTHPSDGLSRYGWTESLDHAFAGHRASGLEPARIARVDRGLCDAITGSGPVRAALAVRTRPTRS